MEKRTLVAVVVAVLSACASARAADESIWSALILATNEDHPKPPPAELAHCATKLENVFGYNQLEMINSHTELMDDPNEHWLIPSKDFPLRVDSKQLSKSEYLLHLQFFHGHKMLAEFSAK